MRFSWDKNINTLETIVKNNACQYLISFNKKIKNIYDVVGVITTITNV